MIYSDAKILIEWIKKSNYKPNDWEKGFLGNILIHKKISKKQEEVLRNIYAKTARV